MHTTPDDPLIIVQAEPLNAETPLPLLDEPLTPAASFFVRSNFAVPRIDAEDWQLRIDGLLDEVMTLGLSDLQRFDPVSLTTVLECAGNGRKLMSPIPDGTAWTLGAASIGEFTGVPLAHVLPAHRIDEAAVELLFQGADSGDVDGRTIRFERSLPIERALHPETMLVWALNGEPLTPEHGHPVRLLVPGYYGVASVKWLTRITAVSTPFAGYFQGERYVYRGHPVHTDEEAVTRIHVRSVVTFPADGALISGTTLVHGAAWSGHGGIMRVEVSTDGGGSWHDAHLSTPGSRHASTLWEHAWTPDEVGEHEIIVRATDSTGATQPLDPIWNELGYANNVAHRVRVRSSGNPA